MFDMVFMGHWTLIANTKVQICFKIYYQALAVNKLTVQVCLWEVFKAVEDLRFYFSAHTVSYLEEKG